jgi:hypothetical protein
MNIMKMNKKAVDTNESLPGFTAEASFYRKSGYHTRPLRTAVFRPANQITPATYGGCVNTCRFLGGGFIGCALFCLREVE